MSAPRRQKMALSFRSRSKGFTLVETAICLGAVGAMLAFVWVAAAPTYKSYNTRQLIQQITTIANNTRDAYTAILAWPQAGDITAQLYGQKVLPPEMLVNGAYQDALGGAFSVTTSSFVPGPPGLNSFKMNLSGMSSGDCIQTLLQLPLSDNGIGIEEVDVNTRQCVVIQSYKGTGGTPVWNVTLPLTPVQAQACCSTDGQGSAVAVNFKLHP